VDELDSSLPNIYEGNGTSVELENELSKGAGVENY
jgi:hypothetical protein